jgi:hypothetical protein
LPAIDPEFAVQPPFRVSVAVIPEQIVDNREPYFNALEAADDAWKSETIDVSKMEELLSALLANQIMSIYKQAGGQFPRAGIGPPG